MSLLNSVSIALVKIYQKVKGKRKPKCLHYPSCSNYAILAFKKYTFFKALCMTVNRVRDCHPFSSRPYIDYP